jgi:hypothetical protein
MDRRQAMNRPDYSRADLILFTTAACFVGFFLGIVSAASGPTIAANSGAWAVAGTLTGGMIGFGATTYHDHMRRAKELSDVVASLYVEIADRGARCLNDYIAPWHHVERVPTEKKKGSWVGKFRPVDPVVYSGSAAKLGLLPADTLIAIVHFYFRPRGTICEAWRQ